MGKFIDLTGQRFGNLTVIKKSDNKSNTGMIKWVCRCDCGNITEVTGGNLKSGHSKSCGCSHRYDLSGKKFGKWTVLEKSDVRNGIIYWLCRCDCGTIKEVRTSILLNGQSQSCGCDRRIGDYNLIGQKFGKLTVIGASEKTDSNHRTFWKCRCDCGNITDVARSHLVNGTVATCGCSSENKLIDLTGLKFGKLTAIQRTDLRSKYGVAIWLCKCECGGTKLVNSNSLTSGNVKSCGCIKSYGETVIKRILGSNNIAYETEKTFESCRDPITNALYKYDFYFPNSHLLEYDGSQHFEERTDSTWKPLIYVQQHDENKNQWCRDNNIPLIRIPYTHLKNICLEDIMLETTKFRVV